MPSGTAVVAPDYRKWYITNGQAFKIPTPRVFASWDFPLIMKLEEQDLPKILEMDKGGVVGFRPGSFLFNRSFFYVISGTRAHRLSQQAIDTLGLRNKRAIWVSDEELNLHEQGGEW